MCRPRPGRRGAPILRGLLPAGRATSSSPIALWSLRKAAEDPAWHARANLELAQRFETQLDLGGTAHAVGAEVVGVGRDLQARGVGAAGEVDEDFGCIGSSGSSDRCFAEPDRLRIEICS